MNPTEWADILDLGERSPAPARAAAPAADRPGLLRRMREGLARSRQALSGEIQASFAETLADADWERLEEALILADVGAPTTAKVVAKLEAEVESGEVSGSEAALERLIGMLAEIASAGDPKLALGAGPAIFTVVGVNGTGKTTTIGKLAWHLANEGGLKPLLAAADTYRAAAVNQLAAWSERAGCEIVRAEEGADPGAVAFDAIAAAESRGADVMIADTAGRLHTRGDLMAELVKVHKVISKRLPGAPHEVLLVIDATTGQNGLRQAKLFTEAVAVTGIVLTKLDGTSKGGIALAIADELEIPIKLIGIGEGIEDLRPFDPESFARALVGG